MALVYEKTFEKLQSETFSELISSTNITRDTPGSKARSFSQAINKKINRAYQDFDINFLRSFLPYAQGRFLDYIGDMVNVPRLGASRANSDSRELSAKVYVATGNFGNLNSGNSISLPPGTIISSLPGNEGILFRTTEGTILPSSLSEVFLSVESITDGVAGNVGPNSLRFSNFDNYTAKTGLLFDNVLINNGSNVETDNNYRFRISNQALSAEAANQTSIRIALLTTPGVSNIITIPYARGIGTFDYIIQTVVPNTPAPVIDSCQASINRIQAYGISGRALRPTLTGMSFSILITWRSDTSTADRVDIKARVASAIQLYINNLNIGEAFIYNELIQRVMEVDNKILNIGSSEKAIEQISIYRETKTQQNNIKETLTGDYQPEQDERLIIEESLEIPIVLTDAN